MTPEDIKEILDKSGYLFEQKVASVIEKAGFHTSTNRAFLDPEENKSREIDVVSHKTIFEFRDKISLTGICYLNCECKNSSTPYVFITRKKGSIDKWFRPDGIFLANDDYYKRNDSNEKTRLDAFYYLQLDEVHYATQKDTHAVQICKIIQNGSKKEAQHSGVIESFIYPLVKSKSIWEVQTPKSGGEKKYCKFFFNLAVVNSKLYTIDCEDEAALPVEVGFVPFVREIQTKELKGRFLITFVNYDYLKDFLKDQVEHFCLQVKDKYSERPSLFLDPALSEVW